MSGNMENIPSSKYEYIGVINLKNSTNAGIEVNTAGNNLAFK
jgi:hypothetical protein